MKIKNDKKTSFIIQFATAKCIDIIGKHFKYFGGESLSAYIIDYNNGVITYEQLIENVYKDVTDYESAL